MSDAYGEIIRIAAILARREVVPDLSEHQWQASTGPRERRRILRLLRDADDRCGALAQNLADAAKAMRAAHQPPATLSEFVRSPPEVREAIGEEPVRRGFAAQEAAHQPDAVHPDTARLDYLIKWLGFNEDVSQLPVRDWNDDEDARVAIDAARTRGKDPKADATRCYNCDEAYFTFIGDCPVCGKVWPTPDRATDPTETT